MKRVLIGSLLAGGYICGGLLFAQEAIPVQPSDEVTPQVSEEASRQVSEVASTSKLSENARIGLATQSPRVHVAKRHKHEKARREDRVVADKHTVNAFIPYGK